MRRVRFGRLLTGLLALCLALTQSDVAMLHARPAHGLAHQVPQAAPEAGCMNHSAMPHDADGPRPAGNHDAGCCTSCCACMAPVIAPARAVVALVPGVQLPAVQQPTPAVATYRPATPAHARPPSQGPPVLPA